MREASGSDFASPVSPSSKKIISIFERLKANLSACSLYEPEGRIHLTTKALCLLNFQHEIERVDPKEYKRVLCAIRCAQKYLPSGVTFETASCDQLNTALDGLFHEFNNPSILATIAEVDEDAESVDSDGTTETDLMTVHDASPTTSDATSPASVAVFEARSPRFSVELGFEACPSSPKFSKMCKRRGLESGCEVGFPVDLPKPNGKEVLGILYFNILQIDTIGLGKKKVEATILSLIRQAKEMILSNSRRDRVDLYALVQFCTTYIPYVQQSKYLPEDEPLSVDVCLPALEGVLNSWDVLIAEEEASVAAEVGSMDSPLAEDGISITGLYTETLSSGSKAPFESLMQELQHISLLGYESEEMETEILKLISKTKNSILENPAREPVEIYALHQFCLRYLPQGEPLNIDTTIAALTSLLEDFDKLAADELASISN